MELKYKILISLCFVISMTLGWVNFFSIENLKDHHAEKYDKYTYAYDCVKEAEITYWELRHGGLSDHPDLPAPAPAGRAGPAAPGARPGGQYVAEPAAQRRAGQPV